MSLFLRRLGFAVGRHRVLVILAWLLVLAAVLVASNRLGSHYDDGFTIPGTPSQQGQDQLHARFAQTSGASGQVLITSTGAIAVEKAAVEELVDRVGDVDGVASVADPFASSSTAARSGDGEAVLVAVRFDSDHPSTAVLDAAEAAATVPASSGLTVSVGGSAYGTTTSSSGGRGTEAIGLLVALVVLLITFGSLIAAGMPLITSILGVVIMTSAVVVSTSFGDVSSTAPTLAEMLGLAVGIDYALFILSRHRAQLAEGMPAKESMARALGTAGSAVVFAGATVIVALLGLSVADIPFLTVMGVAGAVAVALAVCVALTLLPAIALLFGDRLRPRVRLRRTPRPDRVGFAGRWVRIATRRPIVTVVACVGVLLVLALPLLGMRLALPSAASQPVGSAGRITYDGVSDHFGPGTNGPLVVTADILGSTDPTGTVDDLATRLGRLDGVDRIATQTSNPGGDLAYISVVPATGPDDPATADLVHRIRADTAVITHGTGATDLLVTGTTAIQIDVSARLAGALVPFALVVVGISLLLLLVVFRSIAVPLKATLGYLLSVGAGLGATVAVFQNGLFGDAFGSVPGPIVSFLPIIVMGVQFGLAMDYEMFLVTRMREAYATTGDAHGAVRQGFRMSAPVVAAAALIMVSVFAAFVPSGSSTIKPIAFALAVGVLLDAFVVRMTLVPAVLALLGDAAWKLPRGLDRVLPHVDVEGAAIERLERLEARTAEQGAAAVAVRSAVAVRGGRPVDALVPPGRAVAVQVEDAAEARTLGAAIVARGGLESGAIDVDGLLVPEQGDAVRRRSVLVDLADPLDSGSADQTVRGLIDAHAQAMVLRRRAQLTFADRAASMLARLDAVGTLDHPGPAVGTALTDLDAADRLALRGVLALVAGADVAAVVGVDDIRDPAAVDAVARVAVVLGRLGLAVVLPVASPARVHGLELAAAPSAPRLEHA